jgi:hypothetical protein
VRWNGVPRGTWDEVSSLNRLSLPFQGGKTVREIVPPCLRIPYWKGAFGADSGEKSGLASDIDTATVESQKALDPCRPIREDGLAARFALNCRMNGAELKR